MKYEIKALNFTLSTTQRKYVERRLEYTLASSSKNIDHIEVFLSDIHIAQGNLLKHCQIKVQLDTGRMVSIDCTDLDLRVAIHRAADQASWEVPRAINRQIRAFRYFRPQGHHTAQDQFQPDSYLHNGMDNNLFSQDRI